MPYLVAYEYPVLFALRTCAVELVCLFSCFSAGRDTSPKLVSGVADNAEGTDIRLTALMFVSALALSASVLIRMVAIKLARSIRKPYPLGRTSGVLPLSDRYPHAALANSILGT